LAIWINFTVFVEVGVLPSDPPDGCAESPAPAPLRDIDRVYFPKSSAIAKVLQAHDALLSSAFPLSADFEEAAESRPGHLLQKRTGIEVSFGPIERWRSGSHFSLLFVFGQWPAAKSPLHGLNRPLDGHSGCDRGQAA
jgi:hypothetical protein